MTKDELKLNVLDNKSTYFEKKHMLGKGSMDRTISIIVKLRRARQKYNIQENKEQFRIRVVCQLANGYSS